MEEKPSFLEKLSDRVLRGLIKILPEEMYNSKDLYIDEDFIEKCDEIMKMIGESSTSSSSDVTFIYEILRLNYGRIDSDLPLIRPKFNVYSFLWKTFETLQKETTYKHFIGSYTSDSEDIKSVVNEFRALGDLSPWDGEETSSRIIDSESVDDFPNFQSLKKI
jgi:hypothetical protein